MIESNASRAMNSELPSADMGGRLPATRPPARGASETAKRPGDEDRSG